MCCHFTCSLCPQRALCVSVCVFMTSKHMFHLGRVSEKVLCHCIDPSPPATSTSGLYRRPISVDAKQPTQFKNRGLSPHTHIHTHTLCRHVPARTSFLSSVNDPVDGRVKPSGRKSRRNYSSSGNFSGNGSEGTISLATISCRTQW